ncbi:MAG: accessory gene regulator B family protein [Dorea sp.]|jgi:Membrane protein putatively involved in post-translational modification of the autoinducing quorum-sensing peptide|nr:accessory gene regulator B family protein [Dorea sp.]
MRDYTHVIAVCFANKMDEYRGYTESERIVITYGLEIFLNNFLKLMVYLIIGSVCDIFTKTVIAVLTLAILRILSGGYHSNSDLGCLFLTGGMIFSPIVLSKYLFVTNEHLAVVLFVIAAIYFLYVPQDEKYLGTSKEELVKIKISVILVMFGFCLGGLFIDHQLGVIIMFVALGQGLSLIGGEIYEGKTKCNERD